MSEKESSVQEPAKEGPGLFTSSMAVLKRPDSLSAELNAQQQTKSRMLRTVVIVLLILGAIAFGTQIIFSH